MKLQDTACTPVTWASLISLEFNTMIGWKGADGNRGGEVAHWVANLGERVW